MVKKQFALRLDPKLYNALEKWSADEFRSVNAHIEFLLREAVHRASRLKIEDSAEEEHNPILKNDE
ncbi:hypothetical protein [Desulfitobacterium metallireducens]|uniref:Arc-like DNA binding domain-containing protein n=1 Tax=Desulfitobacterium metallireducens DSM 15288 TaxID=871968 RepID=W0E9Q2_9FIRM|nr:hypothetical protein [Desulfitobacterium metallireducens]AHF05954.1 hypothetical protein DESME_01810 [Desulfitobacterium metallireducens DSM 15288]